MSPCTNRKAALAAGLRFYSPEIACRNGHNCPRYASTGHCVECLRQLRAGSAELKRAGNTARFNGAALFTYELHPGDHAAALAYCQALDMQRGRVPALAGAPALPGPFQLPDIIAERRAQVVALAAPAPAPRHMSDEMARHISDER
jgi:hypothetical protein